MGKGIQIKKPEASIVEAPHIEPSSQREAVPLSPIYYLMLILTFPAALVAGYFFLQTFPV